MESPFLLLPFLFFFFFLEASLSPECCSFRGPFVLWTLRGRRHRIAFENFSLWLARSIDGMQMNRLLVSGVASLTMDHQLSHRWRVADTRGAPQLQRNILEGGGVNARRTSSCPPRNLMRPMFQTKKQHAAVCRGHRNDERCGTASTSL